MFLQIQDWKLDVDLTATMAYSAAEAAEHCDCAYCRNFYAAVDPRLRSYLTQFGLDVEAPDALYPYDLPDGRMLYEGEYVVFGRILEAGEEPLVPDPGSSAVIMPQRSDVYDHSQPYFVLSLEGVVLPWLLEEPLGEVVSPANDPEFLEQMRDKLLEKAESNTPT